MPAEARQPSAWGEGVYRSPRGRALGALYSGLWLFFLFPAFQDGWRARDDWVGWVGMASVLVFAGLYVWAFTQMRRTRHGLRLDLSDAQRTGTLVALTLVGAVMCLSVGENGLASSVYLAVAAVMFLPPRAGALTVAAVVAVANGLTLVVPGWSWDVSLVFAIVVAAFAMWGVRQLMSRNIELVAAREENAQLAAQEERNRLARDLHDILGHSLTVITVKAELAGRLVDTDGDRAKAEIADLERLSRDALADVRRAVDGYREVSLPAELARARAALEAAGIRADLPNTTDEVRGDLREVFAWAVREGVTNVIRHSGARVCTVRLAADRVDVQDDGRGTGVADPSGNGLTGLRERAAQVGALVLTRAVRPAGFCLTVVAGSAA